MRFVWLMMTNNWRTVKPVFSGGQRALRFDVSKADEASSANHFPTQFPFIMAYSSDDKAANDNRSNQLNSNNDTYWSDRGYDSRPDDWRDRD